MKLPSLSLIFFMLNFFTVILHVWRSHSWRITSLQRWQIWNIQRLKSLTMVISKGSFKFGPTWKSPFEFKAIPIKPPLIYFPSYVYSLWLINALKIETFSSRRSLQFSMKETKNSMIFKLKMFVCSKYCEVHVYYKQFKSSRSCETDWHQN